MIHIFVINNFAGSNRLASGLRNHLSTILGLRYFVFNTQKAGDERYLVQRISRYFEGEQLRFYCCGGSGTMRNMLNGIINFNNVEMAFFPCGMTNDFLKSFDEAESFKNIDNLIFGKTVRIDYLESNYGRALNTISMGFDSNVVKSMQTYKAYDFFGNQVPYVLSIFTGVIFNKANRVKIVVDGEGRIDKFTEIVAGNGCALGGNLYFTPKNDILDGRMSYLFVSKQSLFKSFGTLINIMEKKVVKIESKKIKLGSCEKMSIHSTNGKPLYINYDGEIVECGLECDITVVNKGLKFVVPRSVEVREFTLN